MALIPNTSLTPAEKRAQRDAAEQDMLLREVEEAVRQDDFANFARTWGKPLVGAVVLFLLAFGGYLFWQSRQEAAKEANSEVLVSALDQLEAGNVKSADEKLKTLADTGDAVGTNARMLSAGIAAQQGKVDEAAKQFAAIAKDDSAPAELRDLARLREITTRYDKMDKAEVVAALKPLAVPGKPYFASAGELLAHAYLDLGKRAEAGALFAQIAKDKDAPESIRSRTRQMAGMMGVDAIEDVDKLLKDQGLNDATNANEGPVEPAQ